MSAVNKSPKQQILFSELSDVSIIDICKYGQEYINKYEKENIKYEIANLNDITFKSGMFESVHSWFRLTPSFSPELVRFFLNDFHIKKNNIILDPFTGKGTTLIECQKQGFKSIGIELNPLLYNITKWSLNWDVDPKLLEKEKRKIELSFNSEIAKYNDFDIIGFSEKTGIEIPKIHNVFRWWKEKILKDLLILKDVIRRNADKDFMDFYNIILSVICLDCANIHRNHPTISFDDNHTRNIDVWLEFSKLFDRLISDLFEVKKNMFAKKANVINGDSTELFNYISNQKIDNVITSPPYPNRFSYIHTTRPQLFFMNLINDANEATELDIKAIGGTWGRATSILEKEYLEPNQDIIEYLDYLQLLRNKNLLMCNYATKYFNKMYEHIKELRKIVSKGFRGVYIVGNSRLCGIEIYTEIILSKIFKRAGFNFDKIIVFRKRGGKSKLYETGICISLQ